VCLLQDSRAFPRDGLGEHLGYACADGFLYFMGKNEEGRVKRGSVLRTCLLKL